MQDAVADELGMGLDITHRSLERTRNVAHIYCPSLDITHRGLEQK